MCTYDPTRIHEAACVKNIVIFKRQPYGIDEDCHHAHLNAIQLAVAPISLEKHPLSLDGSSSCLALEVDVRSLHRSAAPPIVERVHQQSEPQTY